MCTSSNNLRPSLFKIFINDFPSYLDSCTDTVLLNSEKLNCLIYADDIVILSTSHAGLQNRLHQLEKYCDAWCLKVNNKKTKIIVFNKAGRKILENFKFQNYDIDCVSNCKYLGIHFTASGSFHFAQTELYKKALKAYYKLRKDCFSLNPSVKSSMHIFDHTLKPILLYN